MYNINKPVYRKNMASFDYDWTLVNPKSGNQFPSNIDDWEWMYPCIPETIKKYYYDNYMIVIFTNQSKKWKHVQIQNVLNSLDIPLFIVIASYKSYYKPNVELFNIFINNNIINKNNSFYVGDAIGRKNDFSDSDKIFANNIGINIYSPS